MFQQRDQFTYARWITAVSKSEGSLGAPVACLSSVYLWRNQCWMLMGEICGLWLFPSHTQTLTPTQACVHSQCVNMALIWLRSSCSDYWDLNLVFQCFCSKRCKANSAHRFRLFSVLADTWCMFGMKGGTCLSLRMVTRPTPDWLSLSWIMKESGKRYYNNETILEIHWEAKLIPWLCIASLPDGTLGKWNSVVDVPSMAEVQLLRGRGCRWEPSLHRHLGGETFRHRGQRGHPHGHVQ